MAATATIPMMRCDCLVKAFHFADGHSVVMGKEPKDFEK